MARIVSLLLLIPVIIFSQKVVLDPCTDTAGWKTFESTGVVVTKQADHALRFDIQFIKGSGYGGVFKNFNEALQGEYRLSFMMKATVPINNFEIKISNDSLGETIWWENNRNFTYPSEWKRIVVKKRHLTYAWGPNKAPSPVALKRIEFVVTAGTGGKGSVWIKDLRLIPIPPPPVPLPQPVVRASSGQQDADNILLSTDRSWISTKNRDEWVTIDYGYHKEFGGVRIDWADRMKGIDYTLLGSMDGKEYDTLYAVSNGRGGSVVLYTPEAEARYIKVGMKRNRGNDPFEINNITLISSDSISSVNKYFESIAAHAPRGYYPRYFLNQQSYWTVVGVPSDVREALISEDGSFEVDKQRFSIEPFIQSDGSLLTWSDDTTVQTLRENYLPIPTVKRIYNNLSLSITLLARGDAGESALMAQYTVTNRSSARQKGSLYLAIRPFQVNPSFQFLNNEGGFALTSDIAFDGNRASVGDKTVIVSGRPTACGATSIEQGDIVERIAAYRFPTAQKIHNPAGMASGAFQYSFDLMPDDSLTVIAAVPFTSAGNRWISSLPTRRQFVEEMTNVASMWKQKVNTVTFNVPPEARKYIDILRSYVAYILINKDKLGFQPGSRSYERSWIRDGSMTSDALLKLGIREEPKKFIQWYSSYQYENGMVPCVVDTRGPDPVPENDSNGELIFACMEYFRFTNDTVFLRERWPNIIAAFDFMQSQRAQRMTPEYRDGPDEKKMLYGLVTESISHEGYSDKARHSYWDDFFALKGMKDAAAAAMILGKTDESRRLDSIARAFRTDIYNSIRLSMKIHNIGYIPGCAELGDYDPTSTSISLYPGGEMKFLPHEPLAYTYNKYFDWFKKRAHNEIEWDAYTPYEIRNVGAFVYLGQKERAHYLLEWFLHDQRPQGWNDWAEVVDKDKRHARFIGDMPHTWVGSDYINAIRSMFVYEIDDDTSLVIAGGLKDSWVKDGLSVIGLPTHYGTISYSITPHDAHLIRFHLDGEVDPSRCSMFIPASIVKEPLKKITINGKPVAPGKGNIRVSRLPADIELTY